MEAAYAFRDGREVVFRAVRVRETGIDAVSVSDDRALWERQQGKSGHFQQHVFWNVPAGGEAVLRPFWRQRTEREVFSVYGSTRRVMGHPRVWAGRQVAVASPLPRFHA